MNLNIEDKILLEKETIILKNILEKELDLKYLKKDWPVSYKYKFFRLVFSAIGSFTVLWNNESFMKEVPVYHLSLSKDLDGKIRWLDLNGIEVFPDDVAGKVIEITRNLS